MAAKQPEALSDSFHWEVRQWENQGWDEDEWDGLYGDKIVKNIFVTGHVDTGMGGKPSQIAHISLKQKPWSDWKEPGKNKGEYEIWKNCLFLIPRTRTGDSI